MSDERSTSGDGGCRLRIQVNEGSSHRVMAALVAAIHAMTRGKCEDMSKPTVSARCVWRLTGVDARHKAGHDGAEINSSSKP